jgi:hypothetical protein
MTRGHCNRLDDVRILDGGRTPQVDCKGARTPQLDCLGARWRGLGLHRTP